MGNTLPHDLFFRQIGGVEEGLQQMDGGNADDGHRQLNLQNRSIDMAKPFGLVGMLVNSEAGNEGFVAADNDHSQQVGNHHHINQVQYGDHDGVFIHDAEIGYQVPQGFEELTGINDLGDNQAYINRQLQPAAGKNEMREDAHSVVGCAFGRGGMFHRMCCVWER